MKKFLVAFAVIVGLSLGHVCTGGDCSGHAYAQGVELETGGGIAAVVDDDLNLSVNGEKLFVSSIRYGDANSIGLRVAATNNTTPLFDITANVRHTFRPVISVLPYAELGAGVQNSGFTQAGLKRVASGTVGVRSWYKGLGVYAESRLNTVYENGWSDRVNVLQFTAGVSLSR